MAYTTKNFKTKKELKEAVEAWNKYFSNPDLFKICLLKNGDMLSQLPEPITCFQPGLGPDLSNFTGKVYLEGPHYPKPHSWYAEAWTEDGKVVKVK